MVHRGDESVPRLAGKVVALARPASRAEGWAEVLRKEGASVLLTPLIAIEAPDDLGPLDAALGRMAGEGAYDWVVFTSITAVERVMERLPLLGLFALVFSGRKLAAVGKATATALRKAGLEVDRIPESQDGRGLLSTFTDEELAGASILIPRAVGGRDEFPEGARARGARVDVVDTYRTVDSPQGAAVIRERLAEGGLDAIILGSPSQVGALVRGLGEETPMLSSCLIACIGATTALAAKEAGISASTAARPDPEAMVELLASALPP